MEHDRMSSRTPGIITSDWNSFQRGIIAAHGSPMTKDEANTVITGLLTKMRMDALTNHVRTYPPKDLLVLSDILNQKPGASVAAKPLKAPAKDKKALASALDTL